MSEREPWYRWWKRHKGVILIMLWAFGGFILVTMANVGGEDLVYVDPQRPPLIVPGEPTGSAEGLGTLLIMVVVAVGGWFWISLKADEAAAKAEREEQEGRVRQSPMYQELIQKGYSPEEAHAQVIAKVIEVQVVLGRKVLEQAGAPVPEEMREHAKEIEAKWKVSSEARSSELAKHSDQGRDEPQPSQSPLEGSSLAWQCPTCGGPSKKTWWHGDEVARTCVNDHSFRWLDEGEIWVPMDSR